MGIVFLLFSGCGAFKTGEFKISGRVTEADGREGIAGVKIYYEKNYYSARYVWTDSSGYWSIWADENDRLLIWAEKAHHMFQPAPAKFTVDGKRDNINFQVVGWSDNFSDPNSGWVEDSYAKYIKDGTGEDLYEILVTGVGSSVKVTAPMVMPTSYTLGVTGYTADVLPDVGGMYGIVFNVYSFSPGDYYYVFRVRPGDAYYELVKVEILSNGYTDSTTILEGPNSIFTDSGINILEVRVNWNKVELCVNNEVVDSTTNFLPHDSSFVQAGLYAYAEAKSSHTVRFDDFNLSAIGFSPRWKVMGVMSSEQLLHKDLEIKE